MSNTDELRKAAQAALECLENLQGGCTDSDDGTVEAITVWCPEIIDALRAALAQPAASGEPVAWIEGPHGEIRRNLLWKLDPMPPQSVAWSIPLYTMSPKATSGTCTPQPAPARGPLTDAQAHAMWVNATIERTDMGSVYLRGLRDGEAAHGITAPGAPDAAPNV